MPKFVYRCWKEDFTM